jgi:tetratricopeptide (TPR) repeat protein
VRRPRTLLHTLVPALLLFTFSATAPAQLVHPGERPRPVHNPHPPSQPAIGARHETNFPDRTRRGMSLPPDSESERKARARALLKLADKACRSTPPLYEYAMDTYREAAELNPEDERGHVGLGNVYSILRRYDIAARMYARAAEVKPKSAEAHYGLGAAYHAQGKKHEALYELRVLRSLKKKELADRLEALLSR